MVGVMYVFLAVGVTSAVIFWLAMRADNVGRRRASSDGGSYDPGLSSGGDGWSAANWWFGAHFAQSTDTTGSWDSGGGLSGGDSGGDSGGGSDGDGGGGSSD